MSKKPTPDLSVLLRASADAIKADPEEARERFKEAARRNDPNPACPHCGKRHRTLTADDCVDRAMSERKLQDRVVYRAKKHGWKVAHAGRGWVPGKDENDPGTVITPMSPGWPDLACFKAGHRPVFIELKREQGTVDPEQYDWLELMNLAGCPAVIVRPSDLCLGRVDAIFKYGSPLQS